MRSLCLKDIEVNILYLYRLHDGAHRSGRFTSVWSATPEPLTVSFVPRYLHRLASALRRILEGLVRRSGTVSGLS